MKKVLSIAVVAALILTMFAGCSLFSNEKKILGTWEGEPIDAYVIEIDAPLYTFNEDGTGEISTNLDIGIVSAKPISFKYTIEEDTLTVTYDSDLLGTVDYTMTFEDDTLSLVDEEGEKTVLTKVEED